MTYMLELDPNNPTYVENLEKYIDQNMDLLLTQVQKKMKLIHDKNVV